MSKVDGHFPKLVWQCLLCPLPMEKAQYIPRMFDKSDLELKLFIHISKERLTYIYVTIAIYSYYNVLTKPKT